MEERKIQVGCFGAIMILTGTVSAIATRNSEALIQVFNQRSGVDYTRKAPIS